MLRFLVCLLALVCLRPALAQDSQSGQQQPQHRVRNLRPGPPPVEELPVAQDAASHPSSVELLSHAVQSLREAGLVELAGVVETQGRDDLANRGRFASLPDSSSADVMRYHLELICGELDLNKFARLGLKLEVLPDPQSNDPIAKSTSFPAAKRAYNPGQFLEFCETLERQGALKYVAQPRLIATPKQRAMIESGRSFPVLIPRAAGSIALEWQDFGSRFEAFVRPVDAHSIDLKVDFRRVERDFSNSVRVSGYVVPGVAVRSANFQATVHLNQTYIGTALTGRNPEDGTPTMWFVAVTPRVANAQPEPVAVSRDAEVPGVVTVPPSMLVPPAPEPAAPVAVSDSPAKVQYELDVVQAAIDVTALRQYGFDVLWLLNNRMPASAHNSLAPQGTFGADVRSLFDAFSANGTAKILANPKLILAPSRPASLHIGGQYPVIPPGYDAQPQAIEWKEFGLKIEAVAQPVNDDVVRLDLAVEDAAKENRHGDSTREGRLIPGQSISRLNTQMEMRLGQSYVALTREIPGAGDGENEWMTVVVVTPRRVGASPPADSVADACPVETDIPAMIVLEEPIASQEPDLAAQLVPHPDTIAPPEPTPAAEPAMLPEVVLGSAIPLPPVGSAQVVIPAGADELPHAPARYLEFTSDIPGEAHDFVELSPAQLLSELHIEGMFPISSSIIGDQSYRGIQLYERRAASQPEVEPAQPSPPPAVDLPEALTMIGVSQDDPRNWVWTDDPRFRESVIVQTGSRQWLEIDANNLHDPVKVFSIEPRNEFDVPQPAGDNANKNLPGDAEGQFKSRAHRKTGRRRPARSLGDYWPSLAPFAHAHGELNFTNLGSRILYGVGVNSAAGVVGQLVLNDIVSAGANERGDTHADPPITDGGSPGIFVPSALNQHAAREHFDAANKLFLRVPAVTVNLNDPRMSRYLHVEVKFAVPDERAADMEQRLAEQAPVLRDWLITRLSDKTVEQVRGAAGIEQLREEIRAALNEFLVKPGEAPIERVFFDDYKVQ